MDMLRSVLYGLSPEYIKAVVVQIVHANAVHRDGVPAIAGLGDQELRERGPAELLLCAAAPVVIFALVADRIGAGAHLDLNVLQAILLQEIHVGNDAHGVLDLVGDILQQPLPVCQAHDRAVITDADIDRAALGIGKSAYPFQVFVPPGFLILNVLVLKHRGTSESSLPIHVRSHLPQTKQKRFFLMRFVHLFHSLT